MIKARTAIGWEPPCRPLEFANRAPLTNLLKFLQVSKFWNKGGVAYLHGLYRNRAFQRYTLPPESERSGGRGAILQAVVFETVLVPNEPGVSFAACC
jgi:hypothetical protein